MQCPLCDHPKAHKHGKMPNGHQRYLCPVCQQTFSESFDSLSYRRMSILSKFAKCYKPPARVVAYAGLVASPDLLTIPSWVLFVLRARKPSWCITLRFEPFKLRKWVPMRCGHLSQKTEPVLRPRTRGRRLLDWVEPCRFKWINSGSTSRQTHRWTD